MQKPSINADTTGLNETRTQLMLVLALFLIGSNLRPMLTSLGPVLESVSHSLQLSSAETGMLITLPVLCFGIFAPFAPRLLRYRSAENLIFWGMILQAVGIALRSLFGVTGLFIGTFIGGASISVVMVLLPSLIKSTFPERASSMMGIYSAALCLGAAIPAGATVPIENLPGSNWQWALAFWLVPVLVSAVVWLPFARRANSTDPESQKATPKLFKNRLAWQVTLFMGFQSAVAYCVFGWLPTILIDRGLSAMSAGFILSIALIVQLPSSVIGPWLGTRGKDQRGAILLFIICNLIGLSGLFYGPLSWAWLFGTILGLGLGGVFSLALALLVLRAPTTLVAAAISGMAQGIGYLVAATGPLIVGLLHDITGNWYLPSAFFGLLILLSLAFGMGAGRSRYIQAQ